MIQLPIQCVKGTPLQSPSPVAAAAMHNHVPRLINVGLFFLINVFRTYDFFSGAIEQLGHGDHVLEWVRVCAFGVDTTFASRF